MKVGQNRYGYATQLCPKQELVVKRFVQGRDVFVSLPTGSGKSAVFDELRKVRNSVVVVISPLIVWMKDQVRAMTALNVTAVYAGDAREEASEQTVNL